ncbi:hypothetical protein ANN_15664 [Periplaneta americana]|uniref:Uncharacterized protein n=1 Tax=Periplaneta americana TaxID=6978 RepID=A0ABQ8SGZ3_PERAM|nr:hypothetical protein ANN_15664 [Periplaneta americana]
MAFEVKSSSETTFYRDDFLAEIYKNIKTSHRCLIDLRTRSQTPGVLRMSSEHATIRFGRIPNQAPETNKPMILNGPTSRNREGSDQVSVEANQLGHLYLSIDQETFDPSTGEPYD